MEIKELMSKYSRAGEVVFIGIRSARMAPVAVVDTVDAIALKGLSGDRYKSKGGSRQVTLIQQEHLHAVASYLGQESIDPRSVRRNIVVKGLNLLSLKNKRFRVGEALLEYSGECHPCSRMEENLGPGAYNAMRGHGGITAKVLESGEIRVGAPVTVEPEVKS
jgi:MOSC domain-containing protein YiiM